MHFLWDFHLGSLFALLRSVLRYRACMWLKSFFVLLVVFCSEPLHNELFYGLQIYLQSFKYKSKFTFSPLEFPHHNFATLWTPRQSKIYWFSLCIFGTNSQTRNNAGQTIDRKVFENDLKIFIERSELWKNRLKSVLGQFTTSNTNDVSKRFLAANICFLTKLDLRHYVLSQSFVSFFCVVKPETSWQLVCVN